jgi:hypothetical protein
MSTVNENGELDTTENPDGLEVTPLGDKTVEVKIDHDALPDNYGLGILTSLRDQLPPGNVFELIDLVGVVGVDGEPISLAQPLPGRHLRIRKRIVGNSELDINQKVIFEITVENTGTEAFEDLEVQDTAYMDQNEVPIPVGGIEIVDPGACSIVSIPAITGIDCMIGALLPEEIWTTRVTMRTLSTGLLKNFARVGTVIIDPDDEDDDYYEEYGKADVEQLVGPESIGSIFMESDVRPSKRAAPLDYYLNGERIIDDHEPDTPILLDALSLSSVVARLDIVAGSAPDNSEPLASTEVNFLVGEGADARIADSYAITLTQDTDGLLQSIVLPDFQRTSSDPSQATLAVVHAGATAPSVNLRTLFPNIPVADDVAFGGFSPYATLPPGTVVLDATATDGSAREDFKFDVAQGASYLAVLDDDAAGNDPQGFRLAVYRADGTTVEAVISTASEDEAAVPASFTLEANYPNPFNPQTVIRYALPQHTPVRLAVYDVLGREVALLVEAAQGAGRYEAVFRAADLPSGVYVYRLEAGPFTKARTMLLVK